MNLPNGYEFIYVDWSLEMPVYVRKTDGTDVAVISYNNAGEYVDVKTFEFMYSDGEYIFGRLENTDVNLLFKAGEDIILGKEILLEEPETEEEPEVEA